MFLLQRAGLGDILLLSLCLLLIELRQGSLVLLIFFVTARRCLILKLFNPVQVSFLLGSQLIIVLLLHSFDVCIFLRLLIVIFLISPLHLFHVLINRGCQLLLEGLDFLLKDLDILSCLIMFSPMSLRLNTDLLTNLNKLRLMPRSFLLRDLKVTPLLIRLLLNVLQCRELVIQGDQRRFHSLYLHIPVSHGKLQLFYLLVQLVQFSDRNGFGRRLLGREVCRRGSSGFLR